MEIESEFNFFEINKINNNTSKFNPLNEVQSSSEETSSLTYEKNEITINKKNNGYKFDYKSKKYIEKSCPSIILSCERRLIKDIEELKKNENIGKFCEIIIHDYKKIPHTNDFEMIIEFKNYFSIKFIFTPDYPFSPPKISYYSGIKLQNVFDSNDNVLLENTQVSKWTPILWLSTLVHLIELLISKNKINETLIPKTVKYGKRNWNDYLKEEKKICYEPDVINKLNRNLKGRKTFVFN